MTGGLWDLEHFKDLYELQPPISCEFLRVGRELHAKILFRMALSDASSIKRLIPIAILYAASLGEVRRKAILDLLQNLVEARNVESLKAYLNILMDLEKEDFEQRKLNQYNLKSRVFS